ncbi:MAG: hypothetical protein EA422_15955 [Gemmatimonadales bacterium]|nr:MAG: hypothetical protein EA422_15955 [Gemmatimonadales bacterium]
MQALMEDLPTGLILLDRSGEVTYVNSFAREILATDGQSLLDRAAVGSVGSDPATGAGGSGPHASPAAEAVGGSEEGAALPLGRFRFSQTGTDRRIEVVRYAAPEGTLLQLRDLTVQGRSGGGGTPVSAAETEAEAGVEAMRRLSGGVAHDFNNILSVIRSHVQLLLEPGGQDLEAREALREIDESVSRAMGLTRRLLSFARTTRPRHRQVDVNDELRSMHGIILGLVGNEVAVDFHLTSDSTPVLMDPDQLEQVVLTLVISAGDSLPPGTPLSVGTTVVSLGRDDQGLVPVPAGPGDYVVVTVGRTPDPAEPDLEAEEGGAVPDLLKANGNGALGLPSVYGIVEQAWGYVQGHSHPERGNSYRVYLPRAAGAVETAPSEGTAEERAGGTVASRSGPSATNGSRRSADNGSRPPVDNGIQAKNLPGTRLHH